MQGPPPVPCLLCDFVSIHRRTYFKAFLSGLKKSARRVRARQWHLEFSLLSGIQIRSKAADSLETWACNLKPAFLQHHLLTYLSVVSAERPEPEWGRPEGPSAPARSLPHAKGAGCWCTRGPSDATAHYWSQREITEVVTETESLFLIPTLGNNLDDLCQTMKLVKHHEETNSSSDNFWKENQFNLKSCCSPALHFFCFLSLSHFPEERKSAPPMYFYLLEHIRDKLKVLSFTKCHMGFYYGISVSLLKLL